MIVYLVQVMAGLVVVFGGILGVGLLVSYRQKRAARSGRAKKPRAKPRTSTRAEMLLTSIKGMLNGQGRAKGVVDGYGVVRAEIEGREQASQSGNTEREFVEVLLRRSAYASVTNSLERLYHSYEKARFGNKVLESAELDQFLEDARVILHSMESQVS
jgi:hypothetical protein